MEATTEGFVGFRGAKATAGASEYKLFTGAVYRLEVPNHPSF